MSKQLPDLVCMLNLVNLILFLCVLQCLTEGIGVTAGRDLSTPQGIDEVFNYNHTFAQIMAEYASVVYVNDLDSLIAWNCSRCMNLTKGFELVELIVDQQHCLQAYVGLANDLHAIVVAFRGTQENSIQNWMEDLYFRQLDLHYPEVTGAMVHRGFYSAYHNTSLRPRIVAAVLDILQELNGLNVYVTGHSMGGALAAFCSLDLVANYGIKRVHTVTFGQPRIGNIVFAEYFGNLVPHTYRMTHAHDMVPHLPPYYTLFPQRSYHHFGREVWIHKVELDSLDYEVETVCDGTGEDPTCSRSVAGNSISDHLCYMGVFLGADSWGSCSFILRKNVNLAVKTEDGFVIKMPLLKIHSHEQELSNIQVLW
ncbi:hypothetical protein KP509_1Z235400 [Ceratopteris richardii]|nr:hypothetical protein KP509_1Z235400 [Ceratopteris richardii]KAH6555692.1 hypothetical protein KP509_1Z235400 [Ceratopteris richardii]KAH6555694.1 hypothetical protein KP509_1Z235400 [Ceratopteris richardii]KAH6555695.1 hypothetical protein KP509_1Z235400 [Ceratopteris richardii]